MPTFSDLVAYTDSFDASFSASLVAATADQIEELEQLAGFLPESYRDFLETMGQSTGRIQIPDMDLHVQRALDFYRHGSWLSTTQYVRIGLGTGYHQEHPHLEDFSLPDDPPEVVSIPDYTETDFDMEVRSRRPVCGSLLELIAAPVFQRYELQADGRRSERFTTSGTGVDVLDAVEATLLKDGFRRMFFSTATGRYFSRRDAAVQATADYLRPLSLEVCASSALEQRHLAATLRKLT